MIDFKTPYTRKNILSFLSHFLPEDFQESIEENIVLNYKPQFIERVNKLGESASLQSLHVFEVWQGSENDPRVGLSRDVFRLLANFGIRKALVFFVAKKTQNYRFSLVTLDLKWEPGKKVEQEYSNPRRYSFFLGPETKTHTPEECLVKQGQVKDSDDLKSRFSIEVVNKDFYTQIAVLFTKLAGGKRTIGRKTIDAGRGLLDLPGTVDDTIDKEFTVRLIGRLVFCWFLKKKKSSKNIPLLPEELLSAKAVMKNKGYYHGSLEPLFFEVLNTPTENREKKYQDTLWSQIPFLNGGLFNPHRYDFYDPGPLGISKHVNTLKIPDSWIKELFEIFETYNFTIDENTSVDVELSIEPEMLGRIFENLLAEINPETGETARKATGSYYTPRPIVEYMVDESLKQYLIAKTNLDGNKIKSLLTYEDLAVQLVDAEKEAVIDALDTIKVIDPACGSGAFPMGILQKMLLILQKVDPKSDRWLDKKLSRIENKLLKKELGKKLKSENVNYVHKLGIIQSSIYGVDIQPIAVEISKLRFFLSLIVDEGVNDSKENRGIEPLPNLEFKFVCTNSLVGLPKKEKAPDELFETEDMQSIKELKDLRDEYLRSYGIEKEKLQIKFMKTQKKMVDFYWHRKLGLQTDLYGNKREVKKQDEPEFTRMLSSWDPFSDEPAGWFDPEWMFGIADGFDVVIGNPPYLESRHPSFSEKLKHAYQKSCKNRWGDDAGLITKGADLLVYFFESSISFINKNGNIVFITQNAWLDTEYGIKAQTFLTKHTNVISVVDSKYRYFPSGEGPNINTVITLFSGKEGNPSNFIRFYILKESIENISLDLNAKTSSENDKYKVNIFSYSDKIVGKYKWGILHNSDAFLLEVIKTLEQKAVTLDMVPSNSAFSFGQGLNLSKASFVPAEILQKYHIDFGSCFPILYSGAPFRLKHTDWYLVRKDRIDKSTAHKLIIDGYDVFDADSTRKKPPVLIMPRGISKHYCSLNSISAYSLSGVDVYATDVKGADKEILNLWCFFNSSLFWLLREISGRKNLGGGLLKSEAADLGVFPVYMPLNINENTFIHLFDREAMDTIDEIASVEHGIVDKIIFDYLGFNKNDRKRCLEYLSNAVTFRNARSAT